MVKKFILVFLITSSVVFSQHITPPSGYTPNYKFRMWSQGARPSADSLNKNWLDIDSVIYSVSQSVTIDTTDIAYKSKNNTFTNTNQFTNLNEFNEIFLTKFLYLNYTLFEPMSGVYSGLPFDNAVNVIIPISYDTLKVYGIRNWDEAGQVLVIINLMGREKPIILYHDSPLTSFYKIMLPTEDNILIPYLGSVTLLSIENAGEKKYYLISKTF